MKNVILWTIIGGICGYALMVAFAPNDGTLEDGSGGVACREGFFYSQDVITTVETVKRMEALAQKVCDPEDMAARTTTNHRHTEGDHKGELKHAVLLEGELCVINFELTPEAHMAAFKDVCVK